MQHMPACRAAAVLALLIACVVGCGRAATTVVPTPEEQRLVDIIRTDGFIAVTALERDAKNFLIVTTRQGESVIRYRLAAPAGQPLAIQRIDDRIQLAVGDDGTLGTGPDPRGLR